MNIVVEVTTINPPKTDRFDSGVQQDGSTAQDCVAVTVKHGAVVEFHVYPLSNVSKFVSTVFPEEEE